MSSAHELSDAHEQYDGDLTMLIEQAQTIEWQLARDDVRARHEGAHAQ